MVFSPVGEPPVSFGDAGIYSTLAAKVLFLPDHLWELRYDNPELFDRLHNAGQGVVVSRLRDISIRIPAVGRVNIRLGCRKRKTPVWAFPAAFCAV
jgi:hypothetical protein